MKKDIYDVKSYAKFANNSFSWKYLESLAIKKALKGKISKDTKIIDAGCGEGRSIAFLMSMGGVEKNITGIEMSEYLMKEGKKNFPSAKWINKSMGEKIEEIEKEDFDLVFTSMVLDYLDDKNYKNFLRNSNSWLKSGADLFMIFPHPVRMIVDDLGKYFERKKGSNMTPWGEEVVYFHRTVADYINEVIKSGFRIMEVIEPELPSEAKRDDKEMFEKYSICPFRLAILAKKI